MGTSGLCIVCFFGVRHNEFAVRLFTFSAFQFSMVVGLLAPNRTAATSALRPSSELQVLDWDTTPFWGRLRCQLTLGAGVVPGAALGGELYWLMCSSSLRWSYQVNLRMIEVMATIAKVKAAVRRRQVTM